MFCPNCGTNCDNGTKFCPKCGGNLQGAAQPNPQAYNPQPASQTPPPSTPNYYNYNTNPAPTTTYKPASSSVLNTDMPMKWHKFLIYFSLWAGMLVSVYKVFMVMTGERYGGENYKNMFYRVFPSLQTIDMIFIVLVAATAVLQFLTWMNLSKFRKNGPVLLTASYAGAIVSSLFYLMGTSSVLSGAGYDVSSIMGSDGMSQYTSSIVASLAMIVINTIYYKKRAHLFTK